MLHKLLVFNRKVQAGKIERLMPLLGPVEIRQWAALKFMSMLYSSELIEISSPRYKVGGCTSFLVL